LERDPKDEMDELQARICNVRGTKQLERICFIEVDINENTLYDAMI
jgi:hypothetical protein